MQSENNFTNWETAIFLKENFQSIIKVAENYENKKINQR
jgi:hypothetical protein